MSNEDATKTQPFPLRDPLVGTQVGEYEVLSPIGEGGMGVVYEGRQPVIKKRVAIKVLKPHIAADEAHVRRLIAEAQAVNSIGHRNIIDIFSLGRLPDGRPYVVMEFLVGKPLDTFLVEQRGVPLMEALGLLIDICDPLGAAHRAGVIHRDLKPSNVFLCAHAGGSRFVKLLDFGLAKSVSEGRSEISTNAQIAGTPLYMSPEQARGTATSSKSDIYSLGVIAFQLVTGQLPFAGETPMDVMMMHVGGPVPSARSITPELPLELDTLIQRMMAKAEGDRPATIDLVRSSLSHIAEQLALGSGVALGTGSRPLATDEVLHHAAEPKKKAASKLPLALAAIGAVAVGIVGTLALRPAPVVVQPVNQPKPPTELKPVPVEPAPTVPAAKPVEPPPDDLAPLPVVEAKPKTPSLPKPVEVKPTEPKPTPGPAAATSDQLLQRVKQLEQRLRTETPAGEDPDPSALAFLGKYKAEAMMAQSPDDRASVKKKLDDFERSFLGK